MAKVKDLIKDSEFITSEGFRSLKPKVTVVMPTFRRGDNGLFKQAVESILNQSFSDFELIIIDDASVDSTFSQIQHFMEVDSRVAVIRHKRNIGLPAVSEAEAFLKAGADRFFYAFDDDIFHKDAIKDLYDYLEHNPHIHIVHGIVRVGKWILGNKTYSLGDMRQVNYVPNPCLMVEREVLENVGLYDPHVSLVSGCDWDLWIRILSKHYQIGVVKKNLCYEQGVYQEDSLGNMYKSIDLFPIYEIIDMDRNDILLPCNILEREVDSLEGWSSYSQGAICELLDSKFRDKFWYKDKSSYRTPVKYTVVVTDEYFKNADKTKAPKSVYIYTKNYTKKLGMALAEAELCQAYCEIESLYIFFYLFITLDNFDKACSTLNGKTLSCNYQLSQALKQLDSDQLQVIVYRSPFSVIRRFIKHCLGIKKYEKYTLNFLLLYFHFRFSILLFLLKYKNKQ